LATAGENYLLKLNLQVLNIVLNILLKSIGVFVVILEQLQLLGRLRLGQQKAEVVLPVLGIEDSIEELRIGFTLSLLVLLSRNLRNRRGS
jgi:hypothetical protein